MFTPDLFRKLMGAIYGLMFLVLALFGLIVLLPFLDSPARPGARVSGGTAAPSPAATVAMTQPASQPAAPAATPTESVPAPPETSTPAVATATTPAVAAKPTESAPAPAVAAAPAEPATKAAASPTAPVVAGLSAAQQHGKSLFTASCAVCHTLTNAALVGPGLAGVSKRTPGDEWMKKWIRNSSELVAAGDPYALKVFNKYNKIPMPSFTSLSEGDLNDLVDFLKTAK